MPWLLVPILPLLLFGAQILPTISFDLTFLLIPIAAWIGRRFGLAGIIVVALGGVLALGPVIRISWLHLGGTPEIYLISLWVCWVASQPVPLGDINTGWCSPAWLVAALLLLPLSFSFRYWEIVDGITAVFYLSFLPLLMVAMFIFGFAGLGIGWALAGLVLAMVFGVLAAGFDWNAAIGLWLAGDVDFFRYRLEDFATLITLALAFLAGRNLAVIDRKWNPWRRPYPVVALLVIIAMLFNFATSLWWQMPPVARPLGLYGQYLALPFAAFMAGATCGFAGLGYTLGLVLLLNFLGNLAALHIAGNGLWLCLEDPLVAVTFAYLGLRFSDARRGERRPWPGSRWYLYAGLLLLLLPALFSVEQLKKLLLPLVVAVFAALVAALVEYLRRRMLSKGLMLTGEGWLKLALVVAVAMVFFANAGSIFDGLMEIAWQYDVPSELALPAILLLLHLPLALAARMLAEIGPKIAGDLRNIAACWRG